MKKLLAAVTVLAIAICAPGMSAWGESWESPQKYTSGDFEYTLSEGGEAQITGYSGEKSKIVIPAQIDGYLVTGIGNRAFCYCDSLECIDIPDSVTEIGDSAFYSCDSLAEITLPNSLNSIGDLAFASCASLASMTIPDSVMHMGINPFLACNIRELRLSPDSAFAVVDGALLEKCSKRLISYPGDFAMTKCRIPEGTSIIGEYAFTFYAFLHDVEIPDSVTEIGNMAFYGCDSLVEILLPDSLTIIGDSAFANCKSLSSVEVPDSVTQIAGNAFYLCNQLTLTVGRDSCAREYARENKLPHAYPDTRDWLAISAEDNPESQRAEEPQRYVSGDFEYILLEDGGVGITKYIGSDPKLSVPDQIDGYTVKAIEDRAFSWCDFLQSVVLPDSVIYMGINPFEGCGSLTEILVSPDSAFAVLDGVLFEKEAKRLICYPCGLGQAEYNIPEGIQNIGDYAFYYCDSLGSITIPDSVIEIGDFGFAYCNALQSIVLPDSVTHLGINPFQSCGSLTEILVSPDSAFAVLDGVLFEKETKRLICYPRGLGQAEYNIPEGIQNIGDYAFYYCDSLGSITIPDSVTEIGDFGFAYCNALQSIALPDSVTHLGVNPFERCANLSKIYASADSAFAVLRGVLFEKSTKRLICYPCILTAAEYAVPEGIAQIGEWAFSGCENLCNIVLPDSLTSIGGNAFYNCTSLQSITLPDSVERIGSWAFWGPESLVLTVERNSYAREYARANDIAYTYQDADEWLTN